MNCGTLNAYHRGEVSRAKLAGQCRECTGCAWRVVSTTTAPGRVQMVRQSAPERTTKPSLGLVVPIRVTCRTNPDEWITEQWEVKDQETARKWAKQEGETCVY